MSRMITTPVNQVRQTNVAIVRIKKGGKRYEIACYKNKVLSWRKGIEKDINEVLQTDAVFSNVSKGSVAKREDIRKSFGDMSDQDICKLILEKGELQISPKEREQMFNEMSKEICSIVVSKCINPDTKLPYTFGVIQRAMQDIHFAVKPNRSTKQQALEVIKKLKTSIPIERGKMRLKIIIDSSHVKGLKNLLKKGEGEVEKEEVNDKIETLIIVIDPGLYRNVDDFVNESGGSFEMLDTIVTGSGDKHIESFDFEASDEEDKPKKKGKKQVSEEEEEEEEEEEAPKRKSKQKKKGKKSKKIEEQEEEEEEEEEPKKKKKGKKKQKHEEDSEEDIKKSKKKGKKKMEDEEEEAEGEDDDDIKKKKKEERKKKREAKKKLKEKTKEILKKEKKQKLEELDEF